MKKNSRTIPTRRPFITRLLFLAMVIAGAILLLLLKKPGLDKEKTVSSPPTKEQAPLNLPPPEQKNIAANQKAATPPEPTAEPTATTTPPKTSPCQQVTAELNSLFNHLDQQEYIRAYTQNTPIQIALGQIFTKLLDNPPVVTNETSDLLSVIRNSSHLYRVLGRKDLSLLKEIIKNEHSSLEHHIAALYQWSTMDQSCQESTDIAIDLPLSKSYQYAAFFLNTLGGQSYLARRDPTLRVLVKYYCVLTLDRATRHSLNINNINMAYQVDSTIADLAGNDSLENQSNYLDNLSLLKATMKNK